MTFDRDIQEELIRSYRRQTTAEFMLGEKGEHYDGDEWDRLADYWDGRCTQAEARLAAVSAPEGGETRS